VLQESDASIAVGVQEIDDPIAIGEPQGLHTMGNHSLSAHLPRMVFQAISRHGFLIDIH